MPDSAVLHSRRNQLADMGNPMQYYRDTCEVVATGAVSDVEEQETPAIGRHVEDQAPVIEVVEILELVEDGPRRVEGEGGVRAEPRGLRNLREVVDFVAANDGKAAAAFGD